MKPTDFKSLEFGRTIKQRRLELGLTQAQVARYLGVAQAHVTYLENNSRRPSDDVFQKLCTCLSLSPKHLYLLANPEIKAIFPDWSTPKRPNLPPLLRDLKANAELRRKHAISEADITMLSSVQARGEIRRIEDYVLLLTTLRRLFKE
jgi:transcriptional regulator with XRE-family HTH domain